MANALKTLATRRPGESNGVRKWRMLTIGDRSRIPPGVESFHISQFHPSDTDTQLSLSYLHVAGLDDHFKSYITESANGNKYADEWSLTQNREDLLGNWRRQKSGQDDVDMDARPMPISFLLNFRI